MLHFYVFVSTNKKDKCSYISIFSKNVEKAIKLVNKKFIDWNYKGKPKLLTI